MDEPLLRPQCSVCSVTYTRNCTGSLVKFSDGPRTFFMAPFQKVPISGMGDIGALKLRCEDKEFVKLKLEWVKKLWIYQNDHPKDYGCGLTLIFEDKKFVLKPDFVNNLWIKSNYEKNITVIEIESEMFARKNFKPLSVGSTLTGEKNGLNINTILETFQANLLKCGGEINDKPDGLIPPQFSICYVESEYRKTGTGSFVNIEFPLNSGIMRYLFMTAFHVVQICLPDEVTGLKLKFGDNTSTIGNVNLTPDWVKMLCAFPNQMDVFVIEFSQTAMKILSGTNFASLPFACPQINESIFVYQYPDPNGGHVVGIGTITSITSVDNYGNPIIEYQQAHTEVGSSGSPVLNKDFKVVGIHCGTSTNDDFEENKIQYKGKRHATRIDEILKVFKEKLLDRYGGNEKLLIIVKQMEWFEQIPKSALHFIGSGSYGNAYKITVQGGLYYVVKTIEKFGGLDKYNSQVAALTNEFKVITALQNHKLSNWKEFVRDDNKSRILIIMEYLVGGSLFDKIKNYGRLNKTCSLKYLIEILEGLEFLHQQEKPVFHSNLKPSNILFTADDHIKLCDFGIYSVTPPQLRQDCYYMSPERINEDPPSAASDMWSLGVTFVVMATGHTINHTENRYHIVNQLIADFPKDNTKISIEGVALNKYLESLNENDYRRMIISKTLCSIDNRSTAHNLLELCQTQEATIGIGYEIETASTFAEQSSSSEGAIMSQKANARQLPRRIPGVSLKLKDEHDVHLAGMAAGQSAAGELFLADSENRAVRSIKLTADPAANKLDLKLVYRMPEGENLKDIAYSQKTDTLLVISGALHAEHFTIRSLARPDSAYVWRECPPCYTVNNVKSKTVQDNRCTLRALSDGRLVFGVWGAVQLPPDAKKSIRKLPTQALATSCQTVENPGDVLQVLTLDNSRKIQAKTIVRLPAPHSGFDAKIIVVGNASDLLVAAALWFDSVALFRMDGDSAQELYRFAGNPQLPLFFGDAGDKLLVSHWPASTSSTPPGVQELSITGGRIELLRALNHINNYWWTTWCIVPAGIAVWSFDTGQLTVYSTL